MEHGGRERPLPGARDVEDGRKGKRFTPTGKRADIAKYAAVTQRGIACETGICPEEVLIFLKPPEFCPQPTLRRPFDGGFGPPLSPFSFSLA
jgi:hypothetical protein